MSDFRPWLAGRDPTIDLFHRFNDRPDPPKQELNRVDSEAVNLADWANRMLDRALRSKISTSQCNGKVILSRVQRSTILELAISDKIRERLTIDATGARTFNFTADELVAICHALAEPLTSAQGKYRNQLLKSAEKVAQGLTDALAPRKTATRKAKKPTTAFQLKITLQKVKPVVWRRFQVVDCTLPELHAVIQIVMGWQNCLGYCFEANGTTYGHPSLCDDMEHEDGRQISLSHLVKQGHDQFGYVCDFACFWEHTVEVESTFQPEDDAAFPICLEGAASSPPEDVGGAKGYQEFLRIINDPDHPEHERCLDGCGGWFDPDVFDRELVNRALGNE